MWWLSLGWNLNQKLKEELGKIWYGWETLNLSYYEVYGFTYGHPNLIKLIIDENRHQDLSENINYKVIGIVMSEKTRFRGV